MKKLSVLFIILFSLVGFLALGNVDEASAQENPVQCGGIQGLVCPSGFYCEYEDGSKVAPNPDASGICRSNDYDCKGKTNGTTCKRCQPCPAGQICAKICIVETGTCQNNDCTVVPTATPTPIPPWSIAPVTAGTVDLCKSLTISDNTLGSGENIQVTAKSTSTDIISFGYWLYNMDNVAGGNPKPIRFTTDTAKVAGKVVNKQISDDTHVLTINFYDVDRKDRNWNYYMSKPKRIRVDAYFKKAGTNVWSKYNANCSKVFNATTVDPTPTPVASCVCAAAGTCATSCFFDKFGSAVTYTNPIKCNLGAGLFSSAPTAANKNQWCRNYMRTKGDSNGDGKASILDYFYYMSATAFGAKLPPTVNIDFNGDGVISSADKTILMKSLKP